MVNEFNRIPAPFLLSSSPNFAPSDRNWSLYPLIP